MIFVLIAVSDCISSFNYAILTYAHDRSMVSTVAQRSPKPSVRVRILLLLPRYIHEFNPMWLDSFFYIMLYNLEFIDINHHQSIVL